MTYLLDTNTCVEFLRRGSSTPIAARLKSAAPGQVVLCSVLVAELLYGVARSRDLARTRAEVDVFRSGFVSLPFDDAAAACYAALRDHLAVIGRPIGANDLLIAAIALARGLTLVTHNTSEFGRVAGLRLEDWQGP